MASFRFFHFSSGHLCLWKDGAGSKQRNLNMVLGKNNQYYLPGGERHGRIRILYTS